MVGGRLLWSPSRRSERRRDLETKLAPERSSGVVSGVEVRPVSVIIGRQPRTARPCAIVDFDEALVRRREGPVPAPSLIRCSWIAAVGQRIVWHAHYVDVLTRSGMYGVWVHVPFSLRMSNGATTAFRSHCAATWLPARSTKSGLSVLPCPLAPALDVPHDQPLSRAMRSVSILPSPLQHHPISLLTRLITTGQRSGPADRADVWK